MSIRKHEPPQGPERVGEILSRLFMARGWGRRQDRLRLEKAWVNAVGPSHAAHTRVNGMRRGILEVVVDSAVLLQELTQFRKRELLERIRPLLPGVRELRFRAGVLD